MLRGGKAVHFGRLVHGIPGVSRGVLAATLGGLRTSVLMGHGLCPRVPPGMRCDLAPLNRDLVLPLSKVVR